MVVSRCAGIAAISTRRRRFPLTGSTDPLNAGQKRTARCRDMYSAVSAHNGRLIQSLACVMQAK